MALLDALTIILFIVIPVLWVGFKFYQARWTILRNAKMQADLMDGMTPTEALRFTLLGESKPRK